MLLNYKVKAKAITMYYDISNRQNYIYENNRQKGKWKCTAFSFLCEK